MQDEAIKLLKKQKNTLSVIHAVWELIWEAGNCT
jgi:hypothetical protein